MLLSKYQREVTRFLKLVHSALDHPDADRSDITTVAARVKKLTDHEESFTRLVADCCDRALLWSYYRTDDESFYDSTRAVLRRLNTIYQEDF
jgi:hypothetical protein